jgi:polyhydroxybutyrate depolymerase
MITEMRSNFRECRSAGRKARGYWLRVFLFAAIFAGLTSYTGAQLVTHPLQHNGYNRPYLVYRPAHLPAHPAVVFMLGGIRSTAESESKEFGWTDEADRNGFVVVFPEPVATKTDQPMDRKNNITFWEMEGSRTHVLAPGALPVDDDGYLLAVLHDVIRREGVDRHRIFWAGFSSGSGMVQLFASRHAKEISAIAAAATPLMHPPIGLARPMPVLYFHGDEDEQFSGFEANSPNFAATPHGNWVTWGHLDGCQMQTAERTEWGVRFAWQGCKGDVPVIADFFKDLGHEWPGSSDSNWNAKHRPEDPIEFTELAWQFFSTIHSR